jgi:hypothetical protein
MKVRLALAFLLIAAVVVAVVVIKYPPSKPEGREKPPAQRPKPPAAEPEEVVTAYLTALTKQEHRRAYELLSAESRQAHTYEEFAAACKQAGFPSLDVGAANVRSKEGDRATVAVPMVEDPAEAGFTMAKEEGAWKVVFREGTPWFPYP